jgi:hypothetical protein
LSYSRNVKPEACVHGCDGALSGAGTPGEVITKKMTRPPATVMLGYNPSEDIKFFLENDQFLGQYWAADSATRPTLNTQNKLLEVESGVSLLTKDIGKTYVKHVIKIGHCKHCWGPPHSRNEGCMYKGMCRECLCIEKSLPYGVFHHSCRSLLESTPDPLKKNNQGKRKASFDPGAPAQPQMATYTPTSSYQKKQKLLE